MRCQKQYKSQDLLRLLLKMSPGGIVDIPDKKIAKLLNLNVEHLHDLVSGKKRISKKISTHLVRLENFVDLVGDSILIEDELKWLGRPNKAFDGQRPINMLRTAKGYKRLDLMVEEMHSGAFQ